MLSIITASKGRLDIFDKAVTNLWGHAADPENIEHIVATDLHDHETHAFMDQYISKYPTRKIIHRKMELPVCAECLARTGVEKIHYERRNIHRDYWNPIAKEASGDVIFGMGNDSLIETPDYDKMILEAAKKAKIQHGHSYFQILIDDDNESLLRESVKPFDYCSFIILTREVIRVLGGIAPNEIAFSGGDHFVCQIFYNTLYPSQIDLRSSIKAAHISHYTGKQSGPDEVTLSHPEDSTDWDDIASKQYDLALDYAIIKQVKWVSSRMKEILSSIESSTSGCTESIKARLVNDSCDGRGGWKESHLSNKVWGKKDNPWKISYPGEKK